MIHWVKGTVVRARNSRQGVQELEVLLDSGQMRQAILYADEHGGACAGDRVLLNETAIRLGLGSGGYCFVHAVLERTEHSDVAGFPDSTDQPPGRPAGQDPRLPGHMMKLRYTSLQRAVLAAEEEASPWHGLFCQELTLEGAPVLIGELHSMVPLAAAWLHRNGPGRFGRPLSVAYVMSDGGALPLSFSRHAAALKELGWIRGTVTYGHAYGGDVETMNKFTALLAARHVLRADIIIAAMGPGIAGTGTPLGHTGVETGEIANAAAKLGGIPVLIPRLSFADPRERHRGLSHHVLTVLRDVAWCDLELPLPASLRPEEKELVLAQWSAARLPSRCRLRWLAGVDAAAVEEALAEFPGRVLTMGRGPAEDPAYFAGVCAAAQLALEYVPAEPRGCKHP